MLQELHIQNYAVIDNLRIEFQPGLNLLSGETGSGKSILIDALGLALGGRASPDLIRTGEDQASVTAVFRGEGRLPWAEWLEEHELGRRGESEIIFRREIQSGGKSRMLVNDRPATLAAMKALAPVLLEVHGQSEQVALLDRNAQLDLLDQFAGAESALQSLAELYAKRSALEREMETLSTGEQERLRTIDLLTFQLQELDRAQLEPGEDARLEEEKSRLANLEKVRTAASSAYGQLYEEEGSAGSRLAAVARALEDLRRYDSRFEPYLEPLAGARATLEDLALFLRNYLGTLEADPKRLEEAEDRLALIDRLKRKYGNSIEAVLAFREDARKRLAGLERADDRRKEVQDELDQAKRKYRSAARALNELRCEAAKKLEKLVRQDLAQVGMEKTRFEVRIEPLPEERGGPQGLDEVEFLISPNPGEEMRSLQKIASGGELSRLMLALKTVVGRSRGRGEGPSHPTFVFDEVDAGIGGRVAESVGQRLKRLSRHGQVLCVTHLAQIACFADHHFQVEKYLQSGRTFTSVKYLRTEKERAAELARMLSGAEISDDVLKHAAAMLKQAAAS